MLERVIQDSLRGITVVEEEEGSINRILSRQIAESARAAGMRVAFLALVEEEQPEPISTTVGGGGQQVNKPTRTRYRARDSTKEMLQGLDYDMIVIDSFSSYFVDKTDTDAVDLLRQIAELSKQEKSFVIVYETGILSSRANAYLHSVADNLIIVKTDLVGERITRMLFVPKVISGEPFDRLIKITVDGTAVQEDTREFVG